MPVNLHGKWYREIVNICAALARRLDNTEYLTRCNNSIPSAFVPSGWQMVIPCSCRMQAHSIRCAFDTVSHYSSVTVRSWKQIMPLLLSHFQLTSSILSILQNAVSRTRARKLGKREASCAPQFFGRTPSLRELQDHVVVTGWNDVNVRSRAFACRGKMRHSLLW